MFSCYHLQRIASRKLGNWGVLMVESEDEGKGLCTALRTEEVGAYTWTPKLSCPFILTKYLLTEVVSVITEDQAWV